MTTLIRPTAQRSAAPTAPPTGPPRTASIRPSRQPMYLSPPAPIRVAFVVHVMQVAGAEVLVRETIRRLRGRIDPVVFCLDAIGPIGEELRGEGVPVICLGRRPKRDYAVAWRLAQEARARGVQVVHAHQYSPFFYSALAKPLARNAFRLLMTEHGRHYPDVVSPVRRAVNRAVLSHLADAVTACCAFSARALCENDGFPGRRIEVVENGIDLGRHAAPADRAALREKFGLAPDRQYVTMVARFHPVKAHPMLLKAFAEVARVRPDVDLLLAGEGPGRPALEVMAKALGILERVKFLGVRPDVPDLLAAADVFALTSVSEAASLTLMEAMAAGRPVVITAVGGNPELVRDGVDGLLVPRGDHAACARAILRLLADTELAARLGAAARARAEEAFSLARTVDRYYRLYRRLAGRGARR